VSAVAIVALVLGIVVLTTMLVAVPVSRRARRVQSELEAQVGDGERAETVRGLGLESRGPKQVRGTGRLVLTHDELRFRMWVPDRETRIPLASVTDVGTERTWLGKWVGKRLLRVRWRTPEGAEDAMAWEVRDLDAWLAALAPQPGADAPGAADPGAER
jgi:hypothetical protein